MKTSKPFNPWKWLFILGMLVTIGGLVTGIVMIKQYRFPASERTSAPAAPANAETIEVSIPRSMVNQILADKITDESIAVRWQEDKLVLQTRIDVGVVTIPVSMSGIWTINQEGKIVLTLTDVALVGYTLSLTEAYEWLKDALSLQSWIQFTPESLELVVDPHDLFSSIRYAIDLKEVDHVRGLITLDVQANPEELLGDL